MKRIFIILILVGATFSSCKKEVELSFSAQLQMDDATIDSYLTKNGITGVIEDSSGLRYRIVTQGHGSIPASNGDVALNITGQVLNGATFISDTTGVSYALNTLILGLQIGFSKMPKGSTYDFYIPSGLAYGEGGSGDGVIPPNAITVWTVTLRDDDAELVKEKGMIDAYLKSKMDTAIKDTTGVRVVITKKGDGNFPRNTSTVNIKYSGALFNNATVFGSSTSFSFSVASTDIIPGLEVGIGYVSQGGTAVIYIPSRMAYGYPQHVAESATIPGSSILVFTVTLVTVE